MIKTIKTPPSFVAWEADPMFSHEKDLSVVAPVKKGDFLVLSADGYQAYSGTAVIVDSAPQTDIIIAIALADSDEKNKVSAIVRNAVILYDRLNHAKKDDFLNDKPCAKVAHYAAQQQLVFRHSVDVDWEE